MRIHILSGLLLCLVIGATALLLSVHLPVGAVTLAILIGIVIGNLFKPGHALNRG